MRRGGDLTIDDALNFVMDVKHRFHDRIHDYKVFLRLMKFARDSNFNDIKVIHKAVASLFKGHPDLLEGFELFLPVPDEHQDDSVNDFVLQVQVFYNLLFLRLPRSEFFSIMSTIHLCQERGFDVDRAKTEVQRYIGQIPYLIEEFEKFWILFATKRSKPDDQETPKDESNSKKM